MRLHVRARRFAIAGAAVLALAAPGCEPDSRSRFGYTLDVPPAWKAWTGPEPTVPGDILEAYEVPPPDPAPTGEAAARPGSLVVFRSKHAPETTAAQLLTATHHLLFNLPSLRIESEREAQVGGAPAAIIEVVAEGSGRSLYPTGLGKPLPPPGEPGPAVPTRRIWVRIPRGTHRGVIELFFHAPESVEKRLRPAWDAVLASFELMPEDPWLHQ